MESTRVRSTRNEQLIIRYFIDEARKVVPGTKIAYACRGRDKRETGVLIGLVLPASRNNNSQDGFKLFELSQYCTDYFRVVVGISTKKQPIGWDELSLDFIARSIPQGEVVPSSSSHTVNEAGFAPRTSSAEHYDDIVASSTISPPESWRILAETPFLDEILPSCECESNAISLSHLQADLHSTPSLQPKLHVPSRLSRVINYMSRLFAAKE